MKKTISQHLRLALSCALALLVFAGSSRAQTTTFTYQGSLTIGNTVANGNYDLQFKLYDQLIGGSLQGSPSTVTVSGVTVTGGVFTVDLNFGAAAFPGAARYLEIGVRSAGSGSYSTLAPRQQLTSTPHAIRSLSAASADTATTATTATNFTGSLSGDVTGTQGATTVALVGGVSAANLASGATAANNATNANTPSTIVKRDASGNFSAGTITGNVVNAATQFNLNGNRILSGPGTGNLFAGANTGATNSTGSNVTLVGNGADVGTGNLSYATVLGAGATVSSNNTVALGRAADTVLVPGNLTVNGTISGTVNANVTSATNFTGSLSGDVTGTQSTTVVSNVGGVTASNVASGATLANNATNANSANTIVKRDAAGNFTAGTITASTFSGGGASLTNLNAGNITSGTLGDARLTSNVATLDGDQTFTGGKIFSSVNGLLATGTFNSGLIPATGAGQRMMWYPKKIAFRAGSVNSTEWDDANIGLLSVAMGSSTKASGNASFAMGTLTTASGTASVAMGGSTTASGLASIALGNNTTASGPRTTALGNYASTNGNDGSFVYGDNSTTNLLNATATNQFNVRAANGLRLFASSDTTDETKPGLFISGTTGNTQINGNLTVSGAFSGSGLSLTNLSATNITSGTLSDSLLSSNVATLSGDQVFTGNKAFAGLNGFLATGTEGSGSIPATGAGIRMMWYPNKYALRAGKLGTSSINGTTYWDDANIGIGSVAFGYNPLASGDTAFAMGYLARAIGGDSIAMGLFAYATASEAVALGNCSATGDSAVCLGHGASASGEFSTAIGNQTSATADFSTAIGRFASATGDGSTAIGQYVSSSSNASGTIKYSGVTAFGDGSGSSSNRLYATANNQFNARAAGGYRFFASSDTSDTTKPGMFISGTTGNTQINGNLTVSGTVSGSGSSLTSLNASNISSGTLADARLSSNVALLNAANTFTASQTVNANLIQSGALVQFDPTNGFVVKGNLITGGSIPATGNGTRMMWYPGKAAFRAGFAEGAEWDDANIGVESAAFGYQTKASGGFSFAVGETTTASGADSVALGGLTTASGFGSVALGYNTTASGSASTASGYQTTASGNFTTALGSLASTNGMSGSFVYGDNSTTNTLNASATNQFNVRAAGGYRLFASSDTSADTKPGLFISATTGNTQINGNLTVSGSISGGSFSNIALLNAANTFTANQTINGNLTVSGAFSASGASLTSLNASNISSGTLSDARLSSNVALENAANTFTANQTVNANLTQSGTLVQFTPTDGFVAKGSLNSGSIPATGAGARMMWYPGAAAFRAGYVNGTQWDSPGDYSTAFGFNARANGDSAFAAGSSPSASGNASVSIGVGATASGTAAVALGHDTTASGNYSTAIGNFASTSGKNGSFIYGDLSTTSDINATVDNQFVVRAQQMWFGTNNSVTSTSGRFLETSTGAYLTTGGTWTNSSSRALKTNFAPVNARAVLQKVLQLPIQTWNYKAEDAKVRHIGAISQDFHGLFGFGDSAESIATVDADGVAMAAIQGLHEELKDRDAKIERLERQFKQQQAVIDGLRKLLCAQNPQAGICQQR